MFILKEEEKKELNILKSLFLKQLMLLSIKLLKYLILNVSYYIKEKSQLFNMTAQAAPVLFILCSLAKIEKGRFSPSQTAFILSYHIK